MKNKVYKNLYFLAELDFRSSTVIKGAITRWPPELHNISNGFYGNFQSIIDPWAQFQHGCRYYKVK